MPRPHLARSRCFSQAYASRRHFFVCLFALYSCLLPQAQHRPDTLIICLRSPAAQFGTHTSSGVVAMWVNRFGKSRSFRLMDALVAVVCCLVCRPARSSGRADRERRHLSAAIGTFVVSIPLGSCGWAAFSEPAFALATVRRIVISISPDRSYRHARASGGGKLMLCSQKFQGIDNLIGTFIRNGYGRLGAGFGLIPNRESPGNDVCVKYMAGLPE